MEFWPFSLEVYRKPGVEAACLSLQDRFGLDVNVILFACWAGAAGYGRLTRDEIAAAQKIVSDWNGPVVRPLRQVRRVLKGSQGPKPDGPVAALRQAVKDLELEAEWHEQRMLADLLARDRTGGPSRQAARDNLDAILEAASVARSQAVADSLETVLDAAFPG